MDDQGEYLSIAEAATLLGVHRNTIRNRLQAGRYKAHKVVTSQGTTYAIERASLGQPPPNGYTPPLSSPVRDNPSHLAQGGALAPTDQQAQAEAVVQRLLAPFIAELGEVREELGRVKAERDELRRRAEAAESRVVGLERQGRNLAGERDEERRRGDTAEQEGEDLRQRADTLQERHDALRSVAVFGDPPATPVATSEADEHEHDLGDLRPLGRLQRLWRAIRGE